MWPGRGQQQKHRPNSSILPPEVAARAASATRFTPPQSLQANQLCPTTPSFHNNNSNNNGYGNINQTNGRATSPFQVQPHMNLAFTNQPGQPPNYYQSPPHNPQLIYQTPPANVYHNHQPAPPLNHCPTPPEHHHPQPVQAQRRFAAPPNHSPFAPTSPTSILSSPQPPLPVQSPPPAKSLPPWRLGRKEELELDAVSVSLYQHLSHNNAEFRERMEVLLSLFVKLDTEWRPTGIGGWKALVRDSSGACSVCVYTGAGPPPLRVGDWAKIACLWRSWGLQGLEVKAPPTDFLRRLPGLQGCAKSKLQRAFPDWIPTMDTA